MGWNFGDILDAVEPVLPADAPAFIHGDRVVPWSKATRASNNLARALLARGATAGDKIAIYMRNRPEYLIAMSAAFKARLTHVNVNYRYTPDEVWYIFDNADAQTVVYAPEFRGAVEQIRDRLPKVKTWVEVSEAARRALELGLVNAVVPAARLMDAALELAGRITANAPLSVQASKRIALGIVGGAIPHEAAAWSQTRSEIRALLRTEDGREGPRAFAEKRPPVWKGR